MLDKINFEELKYHYLIIVYFVCNSMSADVPTTRFNRKPTSISLFKILSLPSNLFLSVRARLFLITNIFLLPKILVMLSFVHFSARGTVSILYLTCGTCGARHDIALFILVVFSCVMSEVNFVGPAVNTA